MNLGNITNFENQAVGTTVAVSNYTPGQFSESFTNGFSNLSWSVSAAVPGAFGSWSNYQVTTLWYTQPRANVSIQSAVPNRASASTQGGYRQDMFGVGNGALAISSTLVSNENNTPVLVSEPAWDGVSLSRNDYSYFLDNTGFGPNGSFGLPSAVEKTTPASFGSPVRADLYRSRPTGYSDPDTGSSTGAAYCVGYFQLNPDGTMTFTRAGATVVANAGNDAVICLGSPAVLGSSPTGSGGSGTLTYVWSPTNGLSDATAANPSASPTTTTTYTVTVSDAVGFTASDSVQVTVSSVALSPGSPLPNGLQASNYSQTISASGGTAPYTFGLISGSLPSGLTLASGGLLSGTTHNAGVSSFTVSAVDAGGCSNSQAYSLTIDANTNLPPGWGTNFQYSSQQNGSVLAGFRKPGAGTNGSELVVNIGNITNIEALSIGTTIGISNYTPSQLAAAFPTGISNLSWSVSSTFPGAFGTWAGFQVTTIWYTVPRTNVSNQSVPPNRASPSTQSGTRQDMLGMGNGALAIATANSNANNTAYLALEPAWDGVSQSRNDYSYFLDNTGFGPNGSYGLPTVVESTTPASFSAAVRSDLYRSRPTGYSDPDTGSTTGSAYFLGYFELNPNGSMTFTRAAAAVIPPPPPPPPQIVQITRSGGTSTVYFTTTNGATYSLYYTNSAGLTQPVSSWSVSPTTLIGNGLTDSLLDVTTDATRFYRVGAQ